MAVGRRVHGPSRNTPISFANPISVSSFFYNIIAGYKQITYRRSCSIRVKLVFAPCAEALTRCWAPTWKDHSDSQERPGISRGYISCVVYVCSCSVAFSSTICYNHFATCAAVLHFSCRLRHIRSQQCQTIPQSCVPFTISLAHLPFIHKDTSSCSSFPSFPFCDKHLGFFPTGLHSTRLDCSSPVSIQRFTARARFLLFGLADLPLFKAEVTIALERCLPDLSSNPESSLNRRPHCILTEERLRMMPYSCRSRREISSNRFSPSLKTLS